MNKKARFSFFGICIVLTLLLSFLIGCDSILPEDFKEKTFEAPAQDALACSLLSKSISTTATPRKVNDSTVVLITGRTLKSFSTFIPTGDLDTLTHNQLINKYFNQLIDSLPALTNDTVILFEYMLKGAKAPDTIYAKFIPPLVKSDYIFYISLEYFYEQAQSNLGEYVIPQVIRSDTSLVAIDNSMSNEIITSCTKLVYGAGTSKKVLVIKGRFSMQVQSGASYIVRFILSNPPVMVDPNTKGLYYFKLLVK